MTSQWIDECKLMMRGVWALVRNRTNIEALIKADHELGLSRNGAQRERTSDELKRRYDDEQSLVQGRVRVLRRNVGQSLMILASAVVLSILFSHLIWNPPADWRGSLGVSSIFCFAWATLARLGWGEGSWAGDTVVERLDQRLFKLLYWLGTFLGTLALI